jgi:hypothetical protein
MGDLLLIPPGLGIVGFSEEKDLFEIQLWLTVWIS